MKITLWGTRGSLAIPDLEMSRYGGNTSCVGVVGSDGTMLVLDAGTGIRKLAATIPESIKRVDILLSHLHMDHIQGLGFFAPLYRPDIEVHIWGPSSLTMRLQTRLMKYLSPPLFPLNLAELSCRLSFHDVPCANMNIGKFHISSALVCHSGPTVGYRITDSNRSVLTYLPDHEPALATKNFPSLPLEWTSGGTLAYKADLLIHDSQYSAAEYISHQGWGHSSLQQTFEFGTLAKAKHVVTFHHDPDHTDIVNDQLMTEALAEIKPEYQVTPGIEGTVFEL